MTEIIGKGKIGGYKKQRNILNDGTQFFEFGSWTRRRPKQMGLCRGKHAESENEMRNEEGKIG